MFANRHKAQRIDVVFDHYIENSIKSETRLKRGSRTSIKRVVENADAQLPHQWSLFINSSFNKKQLTNFLSQQLIEQAMHMKDFQFATSGGFTNGTDFKTNYGTNDEDLLTSDHEEADTRILLHILSAKRLGYSTCIVDCNDTDVLVLITHFREHLTPEIWLKAGKGDTLRLFQFINLTWMQNLYKTYLPFKRSAAAILPVNLLVWARNLVGKFIYNIQNGWMGLEAINSTKTCLKESRISFSNCTPRMLI